MSRVVLYGLAAVGAASLAVFAPLGVLAFRMEWEHRRMMRQART
jgi:Cys-tRNA synthase (O-phospho-L-seryl-tRNA:Cys-tRNA synthase)